MCPRVHYRPVGSRRQHVYVMHVYLSVRSFAGRPTVSVLAADDALRLSSALPLRYVHSLPSTTHSHPSLHSRLACSVGTPAPVLQSGRLTRKFLRAVVYALRCRYILAVDQGPSTLADITSAISGAVGPKAVVRVDAEEA